MTRREKKVADFIYGIYNRPAWVDEYDIELEDGGNYLDIVMFGSYHIGLYYDPSEKHNDFAKEEDGDAYSKEDLLYAAEIMNNRDKIFEILSSDNDYEYYMTIKEYTEKHNLYETFNCWDSEVVESWEINNNAGDFLSFKEAKRYEFLADNTDGWCLRLEKSNEEEEYRVVGNESAYERFFNGDTTMTEVYKYLLESMEADYNEN